MPAFLILAVAAALAEASRIGDQTGSAGTLRGRATISDSYVHVRGSTTRDQSGSCKPSQSHNNPKCTCMQQRPIARSNRMPDRVADLEYGAGQN